MFHLTIVRPDGREIEHEFPMETMLVGRDQKCNLRLIDHLVSRNHCTIFQEGGSFLISDLGSQNGTWVNDMKIQARRGIQKGDIIQVGPFRLVFSPGPLNRQAPASGTHTRQIQQPESKPYVHVNEAEPIVKPIGMISNYLSEATLELQRIPTSLRRERLNRNLVTLYRITEHLVATRELDEILNYMMDQIFETFAPSSAAILLREKDEFPVPWKEKSAEGQTGSTSISSTIVKRVLEDRVSVLTDNALEDPRFSMGASVVIDGIRSVMAAPVWEDQTILGVLYLATLSVAGGYQPEDLDLLTALGHQTALAIQRWKLTERVRETAIRNAIIRQNLGRFHSPQVVDLILKGAADLEAKVTLATIFFCDIVGSTALCESVSPGGLQEILNLFFKIINEVIFREQGTLDKFIGDGAMAIFGAPLRQDDAPERAVRSALEIRQGLAGAMENLSPELRFKVRYGINTGHAIVGNFGSDERMDYTILGLPVNVAARICRESGPDTIVIGPETYNRIKDKGLFLVEPLGVRPLKGITGEIDLYEVKDFA